jgi:hypothetical protein
MCTLDKWMISVRSLRETWSILKITKKTGFIIKELSYISDNFIQTCSCINSWHGTISRHFATQRGMCVGGSTGHFTVLETCYPGRYASRVSSVQPGQYRSISAQASIPSFNILARFLVICLLTISPFDIAGSQTELLTVLLSSPNINKYTMIC